MGLWKNISRLARQLKQNCVFALGKGNRVKLWEDTWCEEGPLCELFPSLYALADSKGAMAADVWENSVGSGMWNPRFVRAFND